MNKVTSRDIAFIAVFAGLMIALGLTPKISIGITPVPITLQTLGVMLAGALIGWWRAGLAMLLFVATSTFAPVLSGGRTLLQVVSTPSIGYIVGFVLGAMVIGAIVDFVRPTSDLGRMAVLTLAVLVGGIVVVHACGVLIGFMWVKGLPLAKGMALGTTPFLVGDLIKAVVTILVASGVHRALPGVLPGGRARTSMGQGRQPVSSAK